MIKIGKWNDLKVTEESPEAFYLEGYEEGPIYLPKGLAPDGGLRAGEVIKAFVYFDSNDRLAATTQAPYAAVEDFAVLKVASVSDLGAFLDWGLRKDLFLPHAEQSRELNPGREVVVYIYLDKSGRPSSSMRIERHAAKNPKYSLEEKVELIIFGQSDLGYKALINGKHVGMIFESDVFQPLKYAQKINGYIKNIRPDGKIDLSLSPSGHKNAVSDIGPKIIEMLKAQGGFLEITDKTPAEIIYKTFGVSKKKFKIALGALYKKRQLSIHDDGIRLLSPEES